MLISTPNGKYEHYRGKPNDEPTYISRQSNNHPPSILLNMQLPRTSAINRRISKLSCSHAPGRVLMFH